MYGEAVSSPLLKMLVCLVKSEAEERLSKGANHRAKRTFDACDKLFRRGAAGRGHFFAPVLVSD